MKKKALSCLLILAALMTSVPGIPVFAAENNANETQEVTSVGSNSSTIKYEQGSKFIVTIPKTLALNSNKTASYDVKVRGDIYGNESVTVTPDSEVILNDNDGKESVSGDITQEKTKFVADEVNIDGGTTTTGNIVANALTSGSWSGNFNFYINVDVENLSKIKLSSDNVTLGVNDSVQINAYVDDELVNESVNWSSNNANITVSNGLVETKASTQVGETATITVSEISDIALFSQEINNKLRTTNNASTQFTVTVIDIQFKTDDDQQTITTLNLKPGESKTVNALIIPQSGSGDIKWSTTAAAGLSLNPNKEKVTIKAANDMIVGNSYDVIATFGTYSKLLTVNIVEDHVHSYVETITKTATCTDNGLKTFVCDCGDSYTETIPATGHNYVNGKCTECGDKDPNYISLDPGLYDADDNLLCTWDESLINVEKDYTSSSYRTSNTPYDILKYKYPATKKIILPDTVTKIGNYAFYETSIKSIVIPASVKTIGNYALDNCEQLTTVDIENGVTDIGEYAFASSSLKSIKIPNSVTNIGERAFQSCSSLSSVTLPNTMTTISEAMFNRCTTLTDIKIPDNVVRIEKEAFKTCCSLTNIVIPDNVTFIGKYAFNECSKLTSITLGSGLKQINDSAFYGCKALNNIEIPDNITSIDNYAFSGCSNISDIEIPESVTSIGQYAFRECSNLKSVSIPNSVININDYAFWKCVGLTTVTIPSSVTNIGSSVFSGCTGLTDAIIENGVASLSDFMFSGCTNLTQITIPTSVTKIGYSTFANCSNLSNIVIPNGVTSIGNGAFNNCFGFTNITIPENVTSIGYTAFDGCTNLTDVVFKNPNKWYVGSRAGLKDSLVSSSDLAISTKAATYLKKTHCYKYWTQG